MNARILSRGTDTRWSIVFGTDDDPLEGLLRFARENKLDAAHFTAIGAFRRATLGFFVWETKQYEEIPVDEQVEVLSLTGNITLDPEGAPKLHAHVTLARRDGSALGGHLLAATVRPTLEVVLTETPAHLRRVHDPDTGLALLAPSKLSSRTK